MQHTGCQASSRAVVLWFKIHHLRLAFPPSSSPRVVVSVSSALPCALLALLDKYAVRFIPHENGIHTIDVKFNGSHVVGSPFKVRVGDPGQAGNPALVSAYGAGLEGGTTGNTLPLPLVSD